jgi:hypothetical protein
MNFQQHSDTPEYLILGHITQDLIEGGSRPGGTALYSGILAQRLGTRVGLITSYPEEHPLEDLTGMKVINQPSRKWTTFSNLYGAAGREQYLLTRAVDLDYALVPEDWQDVKIIHLGPVAGELQPTTRVGFPHSAVAYSLQGWLRDWDQDGLVYYRPLPDLPPVFSEKSAAFVSLEDLGYNRKPVDVLRRIFPLLALTKGSEGAEIYLGDETVLIPSEPVREIDPTGAGDIFAAAFMVYWIIQGRTIQEAGRLAARLASLSVTRKGLEGIPSTVEIDKIEKVH